MQSIGPLGPVLITFHCATSQTKIGQFEISEFVDLFSICPQWIALDQIFRKIFLIYVPEAANIPVSTTFTQVGLELQNDKYLKILFEKSQLKFPFKTSGRSQDIISERL